MEEGKSKEDLNLFHDNANNKKMTKKKKRQEKYVIKTIEHDLN